MKKSLFSTAALLCAVSFSALQASNSNPYEMSQESARQPRCIRVITEIPVEMAGGFAVPRHSCEHGGLPGAIETKKSDTKALVESLLDSSTKKSAKDEPLLESVLQMLLALTKNLKVVPSVDDTIDNETYLKDPDYGTAEEGTFGVIRGGTPEVAAAREEAALKAKAAIEAQAEATAAEEAAKKAKASEKAAKELAAREAAAKAARLRDVAEAAVGKVDAKAKAEVAAGKPAFTYEEPTRSGADAKKADLMSKSFARREPAEKLNRLKNAVMDVIDSNAAESTLSTNVGKANSVLESLRGTGATYADIRANWGELGIPAAIKEIAFLALPPAI